MASGKSGLAEPSSAYSQMIAVGFSRSARPSLRRLALTRLRRRARSGVFGMYELPSCTRIHTLSVSSHRVTTIALNPTGGLSSAALPHAHEPWA
jgi:hypothetical protein